MPRVTIILTSYNHEKYIREAIDSALSQTFTDFELIIIDDASTDCSWEIIDSYHDPRIIKCRSSVNRWFTEGVNDAILNKAKGEYIAIHHSDDIWESDKLKKQIDYMEAYPDCGAVFTNVLAINENGETFSDKDHFYYNIFQQSNRTRHEWLNYFFTRGNALCHPSVLIRKQCYEVCGLYRNGLAQMPDLEMWVRLLMHYEIHIMLDKLVRFRVRDQEANTSGDSLDNRSRQFFEFYTTLKNYKNITDVNEFLSVFPHATKYIRDNELDVQYAYAMTLIELGGFMNYKLLGLEMLFEMIEDEKSAERIKNRYGFDYTDFIGLTAKCGVLNISLAQHEQEIQERDEKIVSLEYEKGAALHDRNKVIGERNFVIKERDAAIEVYESLSSSMSWRLTSPLRIMVTAIRNVIGRR